jgi:diacylglycerol kinase (ATP)
VKLLIVINPVSGGGKGRKIGAKVISECDQLGLAYDVVLERSLEESLKAVEAQLRRGMHSTLIAVGGDGLVHDLLPILLGENISLLIFPAGTGNDIAQTIGHVKNSPAEILKKIAACNDGSEVKTRLLDVGILEGEGYTHYFIQIVSTGFDSQVNQRANNFRHIKGKIKYVVAVVNELFYSRSYPFTIEVDGVRREIDAMLVCIANGSSYGGGMKIVPHAKNDDQQLEVMCVAKVSAIRLLMVFPRVFFGAHVNHPKVHFFSGRNIMLSAPTMAFGDGEHLGPLPVTAYLSEEKLRILAP